MTQSKDNRVVKPRNQHAVAAFARKGGAHGKTRKAERRRQKVADRRDC